MIQLRHVLRFLWWGIRASFCLGFIVLWAFIWDGQSYIDQGEELTKDQLDFSVVITDRTGEEIHRNFDTYNREWIDIEQLPESLADFTILAEDHRFWTHNGFDLKGITRALWVNIWTGRISQGASTITQQLARNVYLSPEKTIERKRKEIFLALGIEKTHEKKDILEMYLNTAPYGPTLYGVKAASHYYFGVPPKQLTQAQSLVLAMMTQDPVRRSRKREIFLWLGSCAETPVHLCNLYSEDFEPERMDKLLMGYAEDKGWSRARLLRVWTELQGMELPGRRNWAQDDFQHFRFYIQDYLAEHGIDGRKYPEGLRIKTTLDAGMQRHISFLLKDKYAPVWDDKYQMGNFAAMIMDHENRGPMVWIGSKDFWDVGISGQIDMLRSRRQVGSAMKSFIYEALLGNGFEPNFIFWDTKVWFGREAHVIRNADGLYQGAITLRESLARSRNVPAAQALYLFGGEKKMIHYLDKVYGFGIKKAFPNHRFGWTVALGTSPVRLTDFVNGYATLATGQRVDMCPILEIETMLGERIDLPCDKDIKGAISKESQFFIGEALSNVNLRETGAWRNNLTIPDYNIAAKTGTATKRIGGGLYPTDGIIAGYSPKSTIFIWGGNADGSHFRYGALANTLLGPAWVDMARILYKKHPDMHADFVPPSTVHKEDGLWVRNEQIPQKFTIPQMQISSKYYSYGDAAQGITRRERDGE